MTTTNPLEPNHLRKVLTWRDGLGIALSVPAALFSTFGYTMGVVNAWTAIAIWLVGSVIAYLQNSLYAEMASMFPTSSGGISRYAIEGWKKYFAPLGSIAAFGYWLGWSLTISLSSVVLGQLLTATFFADNTWTFHLFGNELGLEHVFAAITMLTAWALNYFGMKIGAGMGKILGIVMVVGLTILVASCFLSPSADFDTSRLTWGYEGDWRTVVVVFYVTAWAVYGTEISATFAPEYKNTVRDTSKAMRYAALMIAAVFFVVPLAVAGTIGQQALAANPVTYIVVTLNQTMGQFSWIGTVVIAATMLLVIVGATADGGRALFGLAQEGMTIKQFDWLNRWGVPGRALTVDLVLNVTIMLLIGEPIAILLASNFGYVLAVVLALVAFVLLRKDRPEWPRPIRRGSGWIAVAIVLAVINAFTLVVGFLNPSLLGYGGMKESLIAVGILVLAVVFYIYRVVVQDKQKLIWRIAVDPLPVDEAERRALEEEMDSRDAPRGRVAAG
ncbi:APC family permease [Mycobacterium sp. 141]|uniref:APC family permease n=1 Tax=Mycobacterium sp. 141 TaxID=1120797 RepID=UPI000362B03B|nr:APC family permease [Mycobacterium sp. 141]